MIGWCFSLGPSVGRSRGATHCGSIE
jgi:hypothetical protein